MRGEAAAEKAGSQNPAAPVAQSKWYNRRKSGKDLMVYLLDSEVHTFAFSVAANAILSFIPFIVLLYTLARSVFRSAMMVNVVTDIVRLFLPSNQDWVAAHLAAQAPRHGVQIVSLIMILISCTGIFLPLEVALNQAWGVVKSRNYLSNQVVAFGLAILMVALAWGCILLSAWERELFGAVFPDQTDSFLIEGVSYAWLTLTSGVACILFFFSVYWLLPNRKVPPVPVLRTAIVTGLIWIVSKYIFVAVLPYMHLGELYGPFYVSVGLLLWAYVSGLILFAGAQFSVARLGGKGKE
jgi:membrane protein/epoxyqueuosine reductase